jgi:hypothetical protein
VYRGGQPEFIPPDVENVEIAPICQIHIHLRFSASVTAVEIAASDFGFGGLPPTRASFDRRVGRIGKRELC